MSEFKDDEVSQEFPMDFEAPLNTFAYKEEEDDGVPPLMKAILAEMGDEAISDATIDPSKLYTCRLMAYKVRQKVALAMPVKLLILTVALEELGNKTIDLFFDKSQVQTYSQYMQILTAIKRTMDLAIARGVKPSSAPNNLFLAGFKQNDEGYIRLTAVKHHEEAV